MDDELEETEKQQQNNRAAHLKPWQFKKGQSGNPAGRPPTKTLKEFARSYLAGLTDDERIEFFEGMDKKTIWEMAEGKPEAILTDPQGNALQQVLVKFITDGKTTTNSDGDTRGV